MQQFPELRPGPMPVEVELRWIAELRDFIRRYTDGLVSEQLTIQYGDTKVEVHAMLFLQYRPTPQLRKAVKAAAHKFARVGTKKYVLQRCEIFYDKGVIHLLIYKKPEKTKR